MRPRALIGATLTAALAKRVCSTPRGSFRVRGLSREDASALVAVVQARNTPDGVDTSMNTGARWRTSRAG